MALMVASSRSRASRCLLALFLLIVCTLLLRPIHFITRHDHLERSPKGSGSSFRKELVIASLKDDDTSWVQTYLSDWKANVYVVNDQAATRVVPVNKGREAMVYLSFIIDNYDDFPDVALFMHSLRYQWHNDDPVYDGVPMIQNLQIPHILSEGYVNIRCVWTLGCPSELSFDRETSQQKETELAYPSAYQELFPGQPVPRVVGVTCCAQFAATKAKIRERPLEDYQHYRKWLTETKLEDATSGRVLEYSWHIIFGQPAVHCPNASECYCRVFGLCNLHCAQDKCGERWPFPPYATLPSGWPQTSWNGESRSPELLASLRNTSIVGS